MRLSSISIYHQSQISTVSKDFKYQEAYDYTLKHVFMFSGDPVLVKLRCSKHIPNIYDKMIDEFGDDAASAQ